MSIHRDQIRGAVEAVEVRADRFSWVRGPMHALPARLRRSLSPEIVEGWLRNRIRDHLYQHFYCPGRVVSIGHREGGRALEAATRDFVRALSSANRGQGSWQSGWRLKQPGDPALILRHGLTLRARAGEYRPAIDGIAIRLRREHLQASPGFYIAIGDQPLADGDTSDFVRLYWHVTPAGAVLLMEALTRALNQRRVPFKLKTLSAPGAYRRCDAFVLYIRQIDFPTVAPECARIHAAVMHQLKPGVPAMTKTLGTGLGLAEDPPDGRSFGESRCDLLAGSLVVAARRGIRDARGRMEIVGNEFAAQGIHLDSPYLNPGSSDRYEVEPSPHRNNTRTTPCPASLLEAAREVSRRLCTNAIWSGDRCNWIGPVEEFNAGPSSSRWTALGPELYGGTSGVAVALAESHARCGDSRARRCALAAMRHALSCADAMAPRLAGFYTGWSGVAYAAARVGTLLREESLLSASKAMARSFSIRTASVQEYDLMSGLAGAIPALLILSERFEDATLHDRAVVLGDRLVRRSLLRRGGRSWRAPRESRERVGLSHGASGAALALLEVHRATGDPRYRATAIEAFRFERRWFRGEQGNGSSPGHGSDLEPSRFSSWCHGAPGLALARIRAAEIAGEPILREEALAALSVTRAAVESGLAHGPGGLSLCHGLAGNADVLHSGPHPEDRDLARRAAYRVIDEEWHAPRWFGAGPAVPGLMLGAAGSIYTALRAVRPDTASVLIPTPIAVNDAARSSPRATRPADGSRPKPPYDVRRA